MKREKRTAMKTDEKGTRMEILNAFEMNIHRDQSIVSISIKTISYEFVFKCCVYSSVYSYK